VNIAPQVLMSAVIDSALGAAVGDALQADNSRVLAVNVQRDRASVVVGAARGVRDRQRGGSCTGGAPITAIMIVAHEYGVFAIQHGAAASSEIHHVLLVIYDSDFDLVVCGAHAEFD